MTSSSMLEPPPATQRQKTISSFFQSDKCTTSSETDRTSSGSSPPPEQIEQVHSELELLEHKSRGGKSPPSGYTDSVTEDTAVPVFWEQRPWDKAVLSDQQSQALADSIASASKLKPKKKKHKRKESSSDTDSDFQIEEDEDIPEIPQKAERMRTRSCGKIEDEKPRIKLALKISSKYFETDDEMEMTDWEEDDF